MTETIRFFIFAVTFTVALFGMALILTGCAVEGAGFENSGRLGPPVVCREIRPGYTQCRSEK